METSVEPFSQRELSASRPLPSTNRELYHTLKPNYQLPLASLNRLNTAGSDLNQQ